MWNTHKEEPVNEQLIQVKLKGTMQILLILLPAMSNQSLQWYITLSCTMLQCAYFCILVCNKQEITGYQAHLCCGAIEMRVLRSSPLSICIFLCKQFAKAQICFQGQVRPFRINKIRKVKGRKVPQLHASEVGRGPPSLPIISLLSQTEISQQDLLA